MKLIYINSTLIDLIFNKSFSFSHFSNCKKFFTFFHVFFKIIICYSYKHEYFICVLLISFIITKLLYVIYSIWSRLDIYSFFVIRRFKSFFLGPCARVAYAASAVLFLRPQKQKHFPLRSSWWNLAYTFTPACESRGPIIVFWILNPITDDISSGIRAHTCVLLKDTLLSTASAQTILFSRFRQFNHDIHLLFWKVEKTSLHNSHSEFRITNL